MPFVRGTNAYFYLRGHNNENISIVIEVSQTMGLNTHVGTISAVAMDNSPYAGKVLLTKKLRLSLQQAEMLLGLDEYIVVEN